MKNHYQEEIQRAFQSKVPVWDKIPAGDPMKILSEAMAQFLAAAEDRYRELLDRTLRLAPALQGFRPRAARAEIVELILSVGPKAKQAAELEAGQIVLFKSGERRFEARTLEAATLLPGVESVVRSQIVEVLTDFPLGTLSGENWEEVLLPEAITEAVPTLMLRFPDDSLQELTRSEENVLLEAVEIGATRFFLSSRGAVIPYAEGLCQKYRARVQIVAPVLKRVVDWVPCLREEMKYVPEKGTRILEAKFGKTLAAAVPRESEPAFQKRFQFIQQHALAAFQGSQAVSIEEIESHVATHFPEAGNPVVRVDIESRTVTVQVPEPLPELVRAQLRREVEGKIGLLYELVLLVPALEAEGVQHVG